MTGSKRPTAGAVRAAYGDVAVRFDLCELIRLVRAGEWAEVIRHARTLREPVPAEVTNLIAYAKRQSADPRGWHGVLLRAVALWQADVDGPGYPDVLAHLVRAALGAPIGDDGRYHALIKVSSTSGHIATSLADGDDLSGRDERRLLFAPACLFLRRRAELPAAVADAIGAELGRCVAVAAMAVTRTLTAAVDEIGEQYNELAFRRDWDHAHTVALRAQQLRLLDRMTEAVTRLRAYLQVLDGLPVPVDLAGVPRMVGEEADSLAAQVAELRAGG